MHALYAGYASAGECRKIACLSAAARREKANRSLAQRARSRTIRAALNMKNFWSEI